MKVYLTRDSVCAADDAFGPHVTTFRVPEGMSVSDLVKKVQQSHLPGNIQGGKATWSITSKIPIAVLAQQWPEPRLIPASGLSIADLDIVDGTLRLRANYRAQLEPDVVEEVLRRLTLRGIDAAPKPNP